MTDSSPTPGVDPISDSADVAAPARAVTTPMLSWPVLLALTAAVSLTVSWISIVVYDRYLQPPPRAVATISLQDVLDAKQAQFAEAISRPGVTDDDRSKALDSVGSIAPEMAKAVEELAQACNCLVLVKEAVVGRADLDLTPQLMEKMGAGKVDLSVLRSRLSAPPQPQKVTQ